MATVATDTAADLLAAFRQEVRGWIAEHFPPTSETGTVSRRKCRSVRPGS